MKASRKSSLAIFLTLVSVSVIGVASNHASAASPKAAVTSTEDWLANFPKPEDSGLFDEDSMSAALKSWRDDRKPAAATYGESDLKADFIAFREKFLKVKTADQLSELLKEGNANYDKYSPQLQFFVAQMEMMAPLRAIVWRLRPIFEHGGIFKGTKATHSGAVSLLRNLADGMMVYLPTDQWQAGFEFLTVPSSKMASAFQFQTVQDYQRFVANTVLPSFLAAAKRLKDIYTAHSKETFVWDGKMYYGNGAFDDGLHRYVGFQAPEMAMILGSIHYNVSRLLIFTAYNQDAAVQVAESMGHMIGIDGYSSTELGVTSKERVKVLEKFRSKNFLRRYGTSADNMGPDGLALMKQSFVHLKSSVGYLNQAWSETQERPDNFAVLVNPMFFRENQYPNMRRGIASMKEALKGPYAVRSRVTGEKITLNLPDFYSHPPVSLLDLMPTAWDGDNARSSRGADVNEKTVTGLDNETLRYRNYFIGRPVGWNSQAWSHILPGVSSTDVAEAARVIFHNNGFGPIAWPVGGSFY